MTLVHYECTSILRYASLPEHWHEQTFLALMSVRELTNFAFANSLTMSACYQHSVLLPLQRHHNDVTMVARGTNRQRGSTLSNWISMLRLAFYCILCYGMDNKRFVEPTCYCVRDCFQMIDLYLLCRDTHQHRTSAVCLQTSCFCIFQAGLYIVG